MSKFLTKVSFQDALSKVFEGYVSALERLAHNPRFTKTEVAADLVALKKRQKVKLEEKITFLLERFEREHDTWHKRYTTLLKRFSDLKAAEKQVSLENLLVNYSKQIENALALLTLIARQALEQATFLKVKTPKSLLKLANLSLDDMHKFWLENKHPLTGKKFD